MIHECEKKGRRAITISIKKFMYISWNEVRATNSCVVFSFVFQEDVVIVFGKEGNYCPAEVILTGKGNCASRGVVTRKGRVIWERKRKRCSSATMAGARVVRKKKAVRKKNGRELAGRWQVWRPTRSSGKRKTEEDGLITKVLSSVPVMFRNLRYNKVETKFAGDGFIIRNAYYVSPRGGKPLVLT